MKSLSAWLAGCLAIGLIFSFIWWTLLETADSTTIDELEIPAGTAAAVAQGREAPFIPDRLVLASQREIRIVNRDSVDHRVGEWVVPPGGVAVVTAEEGEDSISCTIHPSGSLDVGLASQPPPSTMLVPTLLIGIPLGLVGWLVAKITSKLGVEETVAPAAAQAGGGGTS